MAEEEMDHIAEFHLETGGALMTAPLGQQRGCRYAHLPSPSRWWMARRCPTKPVTRMKRGQLISVRSTQDRLVQASRLYLDVAGWSLALGPGQWGSKLMGGVAVVA